MNIDFTNQIKEQKEKDVLHKPFPVAEGGYALFAKNQEGSFVKMLFSNQDHIRKYLNDAGYDWGNEGKDEFTNFDCLNRLLTVMPELSKVETVAADPQWEISEKAVDLPQNSSERSMEDMPDAVELREVDHPIGYDDRANASEEAEEKGYSELWEKVNSEAMKRNFGMKKFAMGDMVENINPDCKHHKSQGEVVGVRRVMGMKRFAMKKNASVEENDSVALKRRTAEEEEQEAGCMFAYKSIYSGKDWDEGDILEKTPDQLEKVKGFKRI